MQVSFNISPNITQPKLSANTGSHVGYYQEYIVGKIDLNQRQRFVESICIYNLTVQSDESVCFIHSFHIKFCRPENENVRIDSLINDISIQYK